jgi:hypothetical protein
MFSGGRDSTLAALRLHEEGRPFALVTVSSSHLVGIEKVRERLNELRGYLPARTPWIHVTQPAELNTDVSFYERTCLPCHHAYVVVAAAVAKLAGAAKLAFGYVGYQSSWPEQSPLAVASLRNVLARFGIGLELPVYSVATRDQLLAQLDLRGITSVSLEQKCLRQVNNVVLTDDRLREQVGLWERAIQRSLTSLASIDIEIIDVAVLGP